ncbi:unnamed protein product [Linum tenue]|uniref:Uncharacterized protein n=1 Tax=Linum tenue TaxID=586396 RepID=A0AAV0ISV6_9ROSI|nr:unnamed protein product [Linum tenue]
MGTSQNRCTIKPLVAALSFHQIFEGMGLGGCIAQVRASPNFPTPSLSLSLSLCFSPAIRLKLSHFSHRRLFRITNRADGLIFP